MLLSETEEKLTGFYGRDHPAAGDGHSHVIVTMTIMTSSSLIWISMPALMLILIVACARKMQFLIERYKLKSLAAKENNTV